MEREIKFRAWHKELEDMTFSESEKHFWYKLKEYPNMYVLMQFTGLKDKNGKEIYEGDIVSYNDEFHDSIEERYKIIYDNETATYCLESSEDPEYDANLTLRPIEVIGNIYENPGLLNKE